MQTPVRAKGTWIVRFAIRLFTLAFGVLVFWLLGFLVEDIRSVRGPDYAQVEKRHLDPALVQRVAAFTRSIHDLTVEVENLSARQNIVGDASRNLQQTYAQLLELQKLSLGKGIALSPAEQTNFATTLSRYLENQRKYQEMSQELASLNDRRQALYREKEQTERTLAEQREPARREHAEQVRRHRLRLAFLQLAILLPILAISALIIMRQRGSIYAPIFIAFGAATLLKVTLVVHEYFPTRYFKYILIGGLLVAVARLLVHFIRCIAFPKAQTLVRQYREAYERFLCPVCDYPIRTGPRRYVFWTRRTAHRVAVPPDGPEREEPYTCPDCGSAVFENCPACGKTRHALLPHCQHCGAAKPVGQ